MLPLSNKKDCLYSRFWALLSINLVKSWISAPVEDKILEILLVDGQRGWPSLVQRLLLLKVVGSSPLHRAKPEQDMPCSVANRSIARQTSSCVKSASLGFIYAPILPPGQFPFNKLYFLGKTRVLFGQKYFFTKTLDKCFYLYYISIRQRGKTR